MRFRYFALIFAGIWTVFICAGLVLDPPHFKPVQIDFHYWDSTYFVVMGSVFVFLVWFIDYGMNYHFKED